MPRPVIALARFSARHRRLVLAVWVLLALALLAGSRALGSALDDDLEVPGSDSAVATGIAGTVGGSDGAPSGASTSSVLVASGDPITSRAADVSGLAAALREVDGVTEVTDPLAAAADGGRPAGVSPDGRAVTLRVTAEDDVDDAALRDAVTAAREAGLDVGVGQPLVRDLEPAADSRVSELVGLAAAVLVLLVALGSAVAMTVPIATALVGVVSGLSALQLLGHAVTIPTVVPTLATMIGLGVGIDYALFQVARHTDSLRAAPDRVEAAAVTAATSGSAVAFAGLTVAVAISALAVTGVDFVSWLGFGTAVVVLVVLLAALTFTPALLATLAPRLVRPRRRWARRRVAAADRAAPAGPAARTDGTVPAEPATRTDPVALPGSAALPGQAGADDPAAALDATRWAGFARLVTRRPWVSVAVSALVLGAMALPAASMTLGQGSDGDRPPGTERRTAYDLTAEHLGAGANATLVVAATLDPAVSDGQDPRVAAVREEVAAVEGVAAVAAPQLAADGSALTLRVTPTTDPTDPATADLVTRLRALDPDGAEVHVGGQTAVRLDLSDRIAARLPWLVLATVAVAALLLVLAFRSVAVALKAAAMDLVSVAAAYGVVTAVFEWGWGVGLLGLDGPVSVDAYVPMMLFAVLFGLSMDYEVFLLSSVREHWRATGDTTLAVRRGVASTGRVITAAAAIMLAVFVSFVRVDDPTIKVFGVGLAVAVLVDATLVRCVLGPAVMVLMGRWTWWLPRRLDRVLPRVEV
ncbi:MMPL family transporter [Cellulomonas sp. C5510]|uniref:MMPL family transporter n=1 Tax=Cellulomonas sp. C5510 TaxID=2871170 RepID=UPI001C960837|nr:MMPL family transporter [Cellulomonas sp. C5510]QZN85473.1 MMPL family transporter [Cellulomonas sp. C5510]